MKNQSMIVFLSFLCCIYMWWWWYYHYPECQSSHFSMTGYLTKLITMTWTLLWMQSGRHAGIIQGPTEVLVGVRLVVVSVIKSLEGLTTEVFLISPQRSRWWSDPFIWLWCRCHRGTPSWKTNQKRCGFQLCAYVILPKYLVGMTHNTIDDNIMS